MGLDDDVCVEIFAENICTVLENIPNVIYLDIGDDVDSGVLDNDDDDNNESLDGDGSMNETSTPTKRDRTPAGIQQKYVCYLQRRIQHEL